MKKYRAGIIGCGKIASEYADDPFRKGDVFTHAEAYFVHPDTELVAICDTDGERLNRCGQRWNINARYLNILDMIETENLNVVSVCTPDNTHHSVIKEILSNPGNIKLILSEKPLATSIKEAQELIDLSKSRDVVISVVYMRRFAENYHALKDFIHSGELGKIQAVSGWYTKGVTHNGTHWFDALRFLVGEVDWVRAWAQVEGSLDDPTLDVMLGMENGALASLRACDERYYTVFEMEILGTQGRIRSVDSGFQIEHSSVVDSNRYQGYKELELTQKTFGNRINLLLHAVEDAVATLKTGKPPACSGEDGLEALRIAASAIESARIGEVVQVHR